MRWSQGALIGLLAAGCTKHEAADPEPRTGEAEPSPPQAAADLGSATREAGLAPSVPEFAPSEAPVFGTLETRHGTITTKLGPDGPLYTVTAPDGSVLAIDLDSKTLAERFPELHELMEADVEHGGAYAGKDDEPSGDY